MGHYNTFVVKIWSDTGGQMTRGHVQHVLSQDLTHFRRLDGLNDFILGHLQDPAGEAVIHHPVPDETGGSVENG